MEYPSTVTKELQLFVQALAEQFHLPTEQAEALWSDDVGALQLALITLGNRIGDTVKPLGDNAALIRKRFVDDLAFLKDKNGFAEILPLLQEIVEPVVMERIQQLEAALMAVPVVSASGVLVPKPDPVTPNGYVKTY